MSETPQTRFWRLQNILTGVLVIALASLWLHFILAITPGNYYTADDVNFFAPLISEYLATGDNSLWLKPQGPHIHIFYKFQTLISMKYFGWSTHFTEVLGLITLVGFGWFFKHKEAELATGSQIAKSKRQMHIQSFTFFFCNIVFLAVVLGHMNKRSFEYHMLALNNPTLLCLGGICLFSFAQLLTEKKPFTLMPFIAFAVSSFLLIVVMATAFNYFVLLALLIMSLVAAGPSLLTALMNIIRRRETGSSLLKWFVTYRAAFLAGVYFSILTLIYYALASGEASRPAAGGLSLSLKFFSDLAFSSTGLTGFPGLKQSASLSYGVLALAILVSGLIFKSNHVRRIDKVFFTGVICFVISFAIGSSWLRGQNVVLAPRYIFSFSFFWIAVAWILGRLILSTVAGHQTTKRTHRSNVETVISATILLTMLVFCFNGMQKTMSSVKFLKKYHQARVHTALYTPLDEIEDNDLKASVFCNLKSDQCTTQVLRMRCFANSLSGEFCATGTQEQLITALDKL